MYILREYYSDLALNKICFWHFIAMSQSTKRRWNSGPSTPSSTSKKKKYNCKFQDEWKKSHYWLQSSSLGNDLAFCSLCTCGQKWFRFRHLPYIFHIKPFIFITFLWSHSLSDFHEIFSIKCRNKYSFFFA
jgi:hypothetical protein